jgi:hypothetical protein
LYGSIPLQHGVFKMGKSKSKADKIEGLKKHKEQKRAKKRATKERKKVTLPASYKKKKK